MKDSKKEKKQICFTSPVQESTKKGELLIELYHYSNNNGCHKRPIKIIRNFDELIDFFENEEVEEIAD